MISREVNYKQGSPEWINWRKNGIGASDIPAIVGTSPYITANKLWKIKKNIIKDYQISEYAKVMGGIAEDVARETFNKMTGKIFVPICAESIERPEFKCSLDGYCNGEIFEAKFISEDYFNELKNTKNVRSDHYAQLQWQMYILGSELAYYFVVTKSERKMDIIVKRDNTMIDYLVKQADKFMEYMNDSVEPPLSDADYYEVKEGEELSLSLDEYAKVKEQIDILKKKEDSLRKFLIMKAPHNKVSYKNIKMFKSMRGGGKDYKRYCDLYGHIVGDEFEKKPVESWAIKIGDKENDGE